MFKNFLVIAFRNFKKSPLTSFIELFGMTVSLTVFLLVLLWVFNETSYDKFNEKADRIYRLESIDQNYDSNAQLPSIIAPLVRGNFPEIEKVVRFRIMNNE